MTGVRRPQPGRWLALVFLAAGLVVLAGCARFPQKADFTVVNGAEPQTLDPAVISGQAEGRIAQTLFEGLLARNAKGELIPGVAERWELSEDGKTLTFHLREDARWSNGDPVKSTDYAESWKRVLTPATGSVYSELLYSVQGAQEYLDGEITDWEQVGVKTPDERTLVVTLNNPTPYFLDLTAFTTLLPVHTPSIEEHGDDWFKPGKLVSNGPFVLEDWYINDRLRLRKNPQYWRRDEVDFETIDVLPTSDPTTAFNQFLAGEADLVADKQRVPPYLVDAIKGEDWFHSSPILATFFYRFNVDRPPFDNLKVRRALALAVDKAYIVEKITKAGEPVTGALTPPGTALGTYTPPEGLGYDPEEARRLLAEAGYPGGEGIPRFSILYNTDPVNKTIAEAIQDMWQRELGVESDLQNQEWKVYLDTLSNRNYDVARSSWVGDYNDPNTFLDCFVTDRGNNRTGWSNAAYDELIAVQAPREVDPQKRFDLMLEAERILVEEELPIIPIYNFVGIALFRDNLGGFYANPIDEHPWAAMFWKDGE
ncbi:MAG: peptide ABC transporter substrate-binding protein [Verrucomicrobiota bacterium]